MEGDQRTNTKLPRDISRNKNRRNSEISRAVRATWRSSEWHWHRSRHDLSITKLICMLRAYDQVRARLSKPSSAAKPLIGSADSENQRCMQTAFNQRATKKRQILWLVASTGPEHSACPSNTKEIKVGIIKTVTQIISGSCQKAPYISKHVRKKKTYLRAVVTALDLRIRWSQGPTYKALWEQEHDVAWCQQC